MRAIVIRVFAVFLLVSALGACASRPPDTRYSGAYELEDGSLVFISPRDDEQLRWRLMNGETGTLWPAGGHVYEGGEGWAEREPVAHTVRFELDPDGRATAFRWERRDGAAYARKLELAERFVEFRNGELKLRGKLVTPRGEGPFPAVVFVHGSNADSAVDHAFEPYLYAAHGFAFLVFDKRGTGGSEGKYLQNFHVLSDDVVAAVAWLRTQPEIAPDDIHLAGFSQGGWIAPLAALKDGRIRSVLVGYGVMKPVTAEDRWGYVYALQRKGFGDAEIAQADRINSVIEDIFDRRLNRWAELGELLDAAKGEPWFDAVKGSDSLLGAFAESKYPLWGARLYMWWRFGRHRETPFIDRLYDPVPTMQRLSIPSLWILAGEDSSAPSEWTLEELRKLASAGKPVEWFVYPNAEHGILRFREGENGERIYLGYEPDYWSRQIEWMRRQSGPRAESPEAVTHSQQDSATLSPANRSSGESL